MLRSFVKNKPKLFQNKSLQNRKKYSPSKKCRFVCSSICLAAFFFLIRIQGTQNTMISFDLE